MTDQQVECIVALVEEGSFSKAAEKLFISQPAISQNIKRMEQQYGVKIFDRSTKTMHLTEAGSAIYQAAKKMQGTEKEVGMILADIKQLRTGTITLGTTPFRATCMLPKSLFRFKNSYPGVKVETVFDSIHNLQQLLRSGEVDFCIEADLFPIEEFRTEEIAAETYYLAVPANHPFNIGREKQCLSREDICQKTPHLYRVEGVHINECGEMPFLVLDDMENATDMLERVSEAENFQPNVQQIVHNLEIMFHWIVAGYGTGLIPDTQIWFNPYTTHPCYYKIADPDGVYGVATNRIVVATNPHRYFSRASSEFMNVLSSLVRSGEWLLRPQT